MSPNFSPTSCQPWRERDLNGQDITYFCDWKFLWLETFAPYLMSESREVKTMTVLYPRWKILIVLVKNIFIYLLQIKYINWCLNMNWTNTYMCVYNQNVNQTHYHSTDLTNIHCSGLNNAMQTWRNYYGFTTTVTEQHRGTTHYKSAP